MEQTITGISDKQRFITLAENAGERNTYNQAGLSALHQMEFPTTRQEAWKYTRTARLSAGEWTPALSHADVSDFDFDIANLDACQLVFVDGIFRIDLSSSELPKGVTIDENYPSTPSSFNDMFKALAAALCSSSLRINIEKNTTSEKSLHIIHLATTDMALCQPMITINADQSSELAIVETFIAKSGSSSFTNRKLNIHVAENAHIRYDKIQMEGTLNYLINDEEIHIDKNGNFTINTLTIDGGWVRNDLRISLDGENIEANLHGIYLPRDKQFVDNHTKVDHRFPHCASNELYKGILNDQSNGVFNGKVHVHLDAQKTNAFQNNANILLSDTAQINTKPELEIYADDVKCSHGTTTGQIDESALFYLKSRGLGEENARKLLSTAFINDVLDKIKTEAVREFVTAELTSRNLLFA